MLSEPKKMLLGAIIVKQTNTLCLSVSISPLWMLIITEIDTPVPQPQRAPNLRDPDLGMNVHARANTSVLLLKTPMVNSRHIYHRQMKASTQVLLKTHLTFQYQNLPTTPLLSRLSCCLNFLRLTYIISRKLNFTVLSLNELDFPSMLWGKLKAVLWNISFIFILKVFLFPPGFIKSSDKTDFKADDWFKFCVPL